MGPDEVAVGKAAQGVTGWLRRKWRRSHPVTLGGVRLGVKDEGTWGALLPLGIGPSLVRRVRIFVENLESRAQPLTLDTQRTRMVDPKPPEGTTVSATPLQNLPPEGGCNWCLLFQSTSPWPRLRHHNTSLCAVEVVVLTSKGVPVRKGVTTLLEPAGRPWGSGPPITDAG